MAETVYVLCAATSIACALLLFIGYRRTRTKLLFASSLCFAGLAANNVLLFIDLVITGPEVDLSMPRNIVALIALVVFLFSLLWESP